MPRGHGSLVGDAGAQAWYEKYFGAELMQRGWETVADIPGWK
jgi:hypothetical protein